MAYPIINLFFFSRKKILYAYKATVSFVETDVSISNGNIKCPIGKSIFAVTLPLKLFRAKVANADKGSLKFSIHSIKMFVAYASEI